MRGQITGCIEELFSAVKKLRRLKDTCAWLYAVSGRICRKNYQEKTDRGSEQEWVISIRIVSRPEDRRHTAVPFNREVVSDRQQIGFFRNSSQAI